MKAILIDTKNETVTDVNVDGDQLQGWYKLIGCDYVTVGHYFNEHDSIIVDDEGFLNQPEKFFFVEGSHQPFAGNGLVVGVDENGETVDVNMTATELMRRGVDFIPAYRIRLWMAAHSHLFA